MDRYLRYSIIICILCCISPLVQSHNIEPSIPEPQIEPQQGSDEIYIPSPAECDMNGDYFITTEDSDIIFEKEVDVNKDGYFSREDTKGVYLHMGKRLSGFRWPDKADCDLNGDGIVDKRDFHWYLDYQKKTGKKIDINKDGVKTSADNYGLAIMCGYDDVYAAINEEEKMNPQHYGWVPNIGAWSTVEDIMYDCFEKNNTESIAQTFQATTDGYLEYITIKFRWSSWWWPFLPNWIQMGLYREIRAFAPYSMHWDLVATSPVAFGNADATILKTISRSDTGWTEVTFDFSGYDFWITKGKTYGFRFTSVTYNNKYPLVEYNVKAGRLAKDPPHLVDGPYPYGTAIWDKGTVYEGRNDVGGYAEDLTFEVGELHLENDPPVVEYVQINRTQSEAQTEAFFPGEVWYDEEWDVFYEDAELVFEYKISDPNGCPMDLYMSHSETDSWWKVLGLSVTNTTGLFTYIEEDPCEYREYQFKAKDHHNTWSAEMECPDMLPSFKERPPEEPTAISYEGSGNPEVDSSEIFTSVVEDCDNESITLYVKWGDGEEENYTTSALNRINDRSYTKTMSMNHEYIWAKDYTVSLQAKDEFNEWSEWTNTSITVDPIPPAGIFSINTVDGTYAKFDIYISEDGGNFCRSKVSYRKKGGSIWETTNEVAEMADEDAPDQPSIWYAWVIAPKTGSWTQGTAYEWKGMIKNSAGTYISANKLLLTKPGDITDLTATKINDSAMNITWNNAGAGVDGIRLYYRYVSGGESEWTDLGYILEKEYFEHTELVSGLYEYKAYPVAQDGGLTSNGNLNKPYGDEQIVEGRITFKPTVRTTNATQVEDISARLWGYMVEWGGEECDVSFRYGPDYPIYLTGIKSGVGHQEAFYIDQNGLTPGEKYVYYARAENSESIDADSANQSTFLTKPSAATDIQATTANGTTIDLAWNNGVGGEGCYIEYAKETPPSPWNIGNGMQIFNVSDTLQPNGNGSYGNDYRKVLGYNDSSYWKIWGDNKNSCRVENIDYDFGNIDITVHVRFKKPQFDYARDRIYIWNGDGSSGSYYNVYTGTGTFNWRNRSHTWEICPWTGDEWTISDINDLQIGFQHDVIAGAPRYALVSQLYVTIETPEEYSGYINGEQCTHRYLDMNTSYFYKFWAYAADDGWVSVGNITAPFATPVERDNITRIRPLIEQVQVNNITNTSAQLYGYINNSGVNSTAWFEWGDTPACTNISTIHTLLEGPIQLNLSGLDICHKYYFRINATNYEGDTTTRLYEFYTTPNKPENFTLDEYGNNHITISWDKGIGADYTYILAQYDSYLQEPSGGRFIINTTGISHTDVNFSDYVDIHYSAWSYNQTANIYSFEPATVNTSVFDYSVFLPNYLEAGDYIISWGKIESRTDQPVVGFVANTSIKNETKNEIIGPVYWNCIDGNYQTTLPTTSLKPGEYTINVRFENNLGTRLLFDYESPLHLSKEIDENNTNTYAPATISYTFYDIATGTGLDDNFYKVYISYDDDFSSGDRVKGGEIQVLRAKSKTLFMGETYYIQLRDFNNNIIPLANYDSQKIETFDQEGIGEAYGKFTITHPEYYVDVGVYLNQLRIKNMNESTVYISLKRTDGNAGQILGRYIPPWEETEIFIPDGWYNLTVDYYDNEHPERGPQERKYPWHIDRHINTDYFAHINGSSLDDVVQKAKGIDAWIYYTIIDQNTGSALGDDIYPIYFSKDEAITEDDRFLGGKYPVTLGETIYYRVTDYWGNVIYPTNGSIYDTITMESYRTFLDIFIPLNQLLIQNENESLIYFRMTEGNGEDPVNNTWYNRWIPPGESKELFVRSATYNISTEYYYPHNGTCRQINETKNMSIAKDTTFIIKGEDARVYFNIYNSNTGLGTSAEKTKIYVDDIRLTEKYIDTYRGKNHQIIIKDYYNTTILTDSFDLEESIGYVDVPIDTYQYKFTNMKDDNFTIQIRKHNQSRSWEQYVGPYESINYDLTRGNYSIEVFNRTMHIETFNITVNETTTYLIFENTTRTAIINVQHSMQSITETELKSILEQYNITNENVLDIIDFHPYYNQTITDFRDEFRETQVMKIPSLKERYVDTTPPQTTITAVVTLEGEIRITWNSVDDTGSFAASTNLSYKKENASQWKLIRNGTDPYGSLLFNSSTEELIEGNTYSFRAIGIDNDGNVEKPNNINTVELIYHQEEIGRTWSTDSIVKDAFSQWIFILIIVCVISLVGGIIYIERKKEKEADKRMRIPYKRNHSRQQENYYEP